MPSDGELQGEQRRNGPDKKGSFHGDQQLILCHSQSCSASQLERICCFRPSKEALGFCRIQERGSREMCTMDHMKKTVEIGSGPSKRALDMGRTSARCSSRIGCGAKPSFMAETGNKTKTPLNEKGNKKKKLLNEKGNNNKTLISEKGKKKNTSLRSSEKEKPKNLEVASSSIPTKPRVVASGDPIAAPNTGKSSLPHRYGLRRLSCTSSSSISDVVQSDTSNVVDHTSSSSSLRGKGASRAFDSLERQSVRSTASGRRRMNSLSRNSGEPESSDPRLIERFAEILKALERIEREEALIEERLTTAFVLGEINFPDQYRDWRLDIDHMSYEELLDLGEKMGTVSTALSNEEQANCLASSLFEGEDSNCSICQEEYEVGEDMGKLQCGHRFHRDCIRQWLGRKNWCPVCKSPAAK